MRRMRSGFNAMGGKMLVMELGVHRAVLELFPDKPCAIRAAIFAGMVRAEMLRRSA